MVALPNAVVPLLWDVDATGIDLSRSADRDLVFERVMSRGSLVAMKWLRATFSNEELAAFVREKGAQRLAPRDLAYWALVSGVSAPQHPGGGRPTWAGE